MHEWPGEFYTGLGVCKGCHKDRVVEQRRARRARFKAEGGRSVLFIVQTGGPRGPVLIGYAANLPRRLAGLAAANPRPTRLLGALPGGWAMKQRLHRRFAADQLPSGWFLPAILPRLEIWLDQARANGLAVQGPARLRPAP